MVFEVMGENLLALVKHFDYKGLPVTMVKRLTRHTLLGLEYIHSRGVIHTDIKLENVLVQRHDFTDLLREAHKAHRAYTEQAKGNEGMTKSQKKKLKQKQKRNSEAKVEVAEVAPAEEGKTEVLSKGQKKKMKKKQRDAEGDAGGDSDAEEPAAKGAVANNANDCEGDESDDDLREEFMRPVPPVRQKERFDSLYADQVFAKLADFGNGCKVDRKVTDDIQTRQYRSPEVIIGAPWNETADVWSAACMFFELLTGDFLFDPSTGDSWSRNEDHLALMVELLGDYPPKTYALSGRYSKEFFTNGGKLKHIKSLKFWPLPEVLEKKYNFEQEDAEEIGEFLSPMLAWQPKDRMSATQALRHAWVQPTEGESDVPDPEKFGPSRKVVERLTSPEVPIANTDADRESTNEAKAKAETEERRGRAKMSSCRDKPDEVALPKAPEEIETAPTPSRTTEVASTQASKAAVEPANVEVIEASEPIEADTTQDVEENFTKVKQLFTKTAAEKTHESKQAWEVKKIEDARSSSSSDCVSLVAVFDPSDRQDLISVIIEAGSCMENDPLDDRHELVRIKASSSSSAVVAAAELARQATKVKKWMSQQDYQDFEKSCDGRTAQQKMEEELIEECENEKANKKSKKKAKK